MWGPIKQAFKDAFRLTKAYSFGFLILTPIIDLGSFIVLYFQKLIIDDITLNISGKMSFENASSQIIIILTALLVYYLISNSLSALVNYIGFSWYRDLFRKIRVEAAGKLKDLPISFFESESVGRIQEKIGAGTQAKVDIVGNMFDQFIPETIAVLVAFPILLRVNAKLAIIGITGIPVFMIIRYVMFKKIQKLTETARKYREDFGAVENELYHQIKIIKAFNKSDYQLNVLKKLADDILHNDQKQQSISQTYHYFSQVSTNIPSLIMLGFASYAALAGQITPGDVLLFVGYLSRIYQPLWGISRALSSLQQQTVAATRLDEMLAKESEFAEEDGGENKKVEKGDIEFKNVTFCYENKKKVLNKINLKIPQGSVVAFVGPSGVGKSTIVKLLLRLSDAESGKILVAKEDITKIPKKTVRNSIGLVFQDSLLFNNTVRNNIRYGKISAKIDEIQDAAKKANAHDFIMKLPKGYNTIVGERGVKLSGGEQQRINLARAILKNPPILILDEATSSLDSENEKIIQDALWKLIEGRTTIIIAHRLATVKKADKILFMDGGKIAEEGSHEELMKNYRRRKKNLKLLKRNIF